MDALYEKDSILEEYYNTSTKERIELIKGVFYNMAPPTRQHQKLVMEISFRIREYIEDKGGDCEVYPSPFGVQLSEDEDTVVEPDITVVCDKSKLTDRGCLGAPDWIIEIVSPSNPAHDYLTKMSLYMTVGVREYWIVDPMSENVAVYTPENKRPDIYDFNDKVKAGIYEDLYIDFSGMKG
ncbi:MAG: Uma2 family endonuclease [Lachnospiraceae bacterium]|nr:Uma2 family endonuclease [Lachnospiraceae bacterium]